MSVDKKHYIHSRGGLIGGDGISSPADVDNIVLDVRGRTAPRHLTIHFHGGLVSKAAGFDIAGSLLPVYVGGPQNAAVFYIWESGAWETIRNNFTELADEPVFKQLLRKVLEHSLKRLGLTDGARSIAPAQVDPDEVRRTLERFIANPGPDTIPYKGYEPMAAPAQTRSAIAFVDEAELQADLEQDDEFREAIASLPDIPAQRRSVLAPAPALERRTSFALLASETLSEDPGRRGLVTWWKVASFLKDVIVGVLKRYVAKRDHGLYATCVEEIVRAFKLAGSGANEWAKALQWNRMKQDCLDAFGTDMNKQAGTALLWRLRDAVQSGLELDRITLVGHSTGAIYICEWIEAADQVLPASVAFDVVFLAPAVSYERFDRTLKRCKDRIRHFRMFGMSDDLERADQVWGDDPAIAEKDWRRFIYPSSLLYLVSGVLESKESEDGRLSDEPDMPLLGMQRYCSRTDIYKAEAFPEVERVRKWLDASPGRTVWSLAQDVGPGLNSLCNDHGGFDNEEVTVESLRHIVTSGF